MLRRFFLAILLVGVMALGIVACTPANVQSAETQQNEDQPSASLQATTGAFSGTPETDTVVIDITSEPININSMMVSDQISMSVLQHTMSGLTLLDGNDKPKAAIAESWEISEDKSRYTFKLRQDAKWSNGDPVTAGNFYYAFMWQLNPANGAVGAYFLYENIKGAQEYYDGKSDASQIGLKVIDDYTLEIEWNRPMTDGLFYTSLPAYLPVNQNAFEQIGADQYAMDADKIVTNGPYSITEWLHDDHMTLEKFADYYDADKVNIPNVRLGLPPCN